MHVCVHVYQYCMFNRFLTDSNSFTDHFRYIFCLFEVNTIKPSFRDSLYVIMWATCKIIVIYDFANFIVHKRTRELRHSLSYDFRAGTGALKTCFINSVSRFMIFGNREYVVNVVLNNAEIRCFFIQWFSRVPIWFFQH